MFFQERLSFSELKILLTPNVCFPQYPQILQFSGHQVGVQQFNSVLTFTTQSLCRPRRLRARPTRLTDLRLRPWVPALVLLDPVTLKTWSVLIQRWVSPCLQGLHSQVYFPPTSNYTISQLPQPHLKLHLPLLADDSQIRIFKPECS